MAKSKKREAKPALLFPDCPSCGYIDHNQILEQGCQCLCHPRRTLRNRIDQAALTRARFARDAEIAMEDVTHFAQGVLQNPTHALSWSSNAFDHAVRRLVNLEIAAEFIGGHSAKEIRDRVQSEVNQIARAGLFRSTSMTSNLSDERRLCILASTLDRLDYIVDVDAEIVEAVKALEEAEAKVERIRRDAATILGAAMRASR